MQPLPEKQKSHEIFRSTASTVDIPTGLDPQAKQSRTVALLAALCAAALFESSRRTVNRSLLLDVPTGWEPRTKQQQRVALADFSAAPWQGFEKSERGPNTSSLFQPQAAVAVVALG